jgi:hypothetical protein
VSLLAYLLSLAATNNYPSAKTRLRFHAALATNQRFRLCITKSARGFAMNSPPSTQRVETPEKSAPVVQDLSVIMGCRENQASYTPYCRCNLVN